jgi:hypothetical protein
MAAKGYRTDQASSDRWLSPDGPYTGDGNTRREITDGVRLETRTADGNKVAGASRPQVASQADKDKKSISHLERLSKKLKK